MRHYLASSAGLCHADSLTSELCDELTGGLLSRFSLSCLQKIPGLSRTPTTFFQDSLVALQCLNIQTSSSYLLYMYSLTVPSSAKRSSKKLMTDDLNKYGGNDEIWCSYCNAGIVTDNHMLHVIGHHIACKHLLP